jgi:hypothetical protein
MFVRYGGTIFYKDAVRVKGAVRIKRFTPLRLLKEGFDFEPVTFILILCFYFCQISLQFLFVFREHGNVTWLTLRLPSLSHRLLCKGKEYEQQTGSS